MELSVLTESSVVVVSDHQTSTEVGGESVILDLDRGVYYGLNEVGARIYTLMETPIEIEAIIDTLTEEYEVARDQCREDVFDLLQDLEEHDLVVVK